MDEGRGPANDLSPRDMRGELERPYGPVGRGFAETLEDRELVERLDRVHQFSKAFTGKAEDLLSSQAERDIEAHRARASLAPAHE